MKTKQTNAKSLQSTTLCYSIAKSTVEVSLTFLKVEKTKHESFNFVSFSFFIMHSSKLYKVFVYIVRTGQLLSYWGSSLSGGSELCVSYDW